MPDPTLIIVAVVIIAILIAAVWWYSMRQRSEKLRERFGPEYERTVAEKGDTRRAENELTARQKRVSQLDIRLLAADERRRFNDEWRAVQARFVDDPSTAVRDADALVGRVMEARGYPVGDFEQRSADVSVDHPTVLEHYRAAHEIALRHAQGQASTEDLRQAMVNYRALFAELLEEPRTVETRPDTAGRAAS
jgi:FtsZ-interacting cell division protein ZipA